MSSHDNWMAARKEKVNKADIKYPQVLNSASLKLNVPMQQGYTSMLCI